MHLPGWLRLPGCLLRKGTEHAPGAGWLSGGDAPLPLPAPAAASAASEPSLERRSAMQWLKEKMNSKSSGE
jgi:hypothetical protein